MIIILKQFMKKLEKDLKALANRRRLAILKYLKSKKEASVGDVAEKIKLSFRSTSRHLNILNSASIIEREQRSLQVFYRLSEDLPAIIKNFISFL